MAVCHPALKPSVRYESLQWNAVGVDYLHSRDGGLPEHHHREVQIAIPLRYTAMRATWQTPTGRQCAQLIETDAVCVTAQGQPHTMQWEDDAEVIWFFLAPSYLAYAAHDLIARDPGELRGDANTPDAFLKQIGTALQTEFIAGHTPERMYVESAATMLSVHLLRQYYTERHVVRASPVGLAAHHLRMVREYVSANLANDLSLATLAMICHLSPYHFARAFRQATGQTPHRYVVTQRLAHAQRLLRETMVPISMIATDTGFGTQSHFTTHFRRHFGTTPRRYRIETTA